MPIEKHNVPAGRGALVQQIKLGFAGYEFTLPTDPAAVHQGIPFPQLLVAVALEVANIKQILDDIIIATRRLDVEKLRTELIALQGLNPEAAIQTELVIEAVDQLQEVHDLILQARLAAVKQAHDEAGLAGEENEHG